jgi:5-methylcytosine-specific restriction endonuclease McrA
LRLGSATECKVKAASVKKHSIKSHLAPYSILQKRKTTINHAFASAIAPVDEYDEAKLVAAILLLGQDPASDLTCVYCDLHATTWDHLVGLVENAELRGYGHQIGNLLPCCRDCNSKKGAKRWDVYLREAVPDLMAFEAKQKLIAGYIERHAVAVNLKRAAEKLPADWARYSAIKQEIFKLMDEADSIAARLRAVVASRED